MSFARDFTSVLADQFNTLLALLE